MNSVWHGGDEALGNLALYAPMDLIGVPKWMNFTLDAIWNPPQPSKSRRDGVYVWAN